MGLNGKRRTLDAGEGAGSRGQQHSSCVGREDVGGRGWRVMCKHFVRSWRLTCTRGMIFSVHAVPEAEPVSESSEWKVTKVGN